MQQTIFAQQSRQHARSTPKPAGHSTITKRKCCGKRTGPTGSAKFQPCRVKAIAETNHLLQYYDVSGHKIGFQMRSESFVGRSVLVLIWVC